MGMAATPTPTPTILQSPLQPMVSVYVCMHIQSCVLYVNFFFTFKYLFIPSHFTFWLAKNNLNTWEYSLLLYFGYCHFFFFLFLSLSCCHFWEIPTWSSPSCSSSSFIHFLKASFTLLLFFAHYCGRCKLYIIYSFFMAGLMFG